MQNNKLITQITNQIIDIKIITRMVDILTLFIRSPWNNSVFNHPKRIQYLPKKVFVYI